MTEPYFNYYDAITKTQATKRIPLNELINEIRTENPIVLEARAHGKFTAEYDTIKIRRIHSFQPNAISLTGEHNKDLSLIPTGYIYLDIDNFENEQELQLYKYDIIHNHKFIYACWNSLSNTGLSILVKVDDFVTKDKYSIYWDSLNEVFDYRLDKGSKSYCKLCCISYDPSIYVNDNCIPFKTGVKKSITHTNTKKEDIISTDDTFLQEQFEIYKNKYPSIFTSGLDYKTFIDETLFDDVNEPFVFPKPIDSLSFAIFKGLKVREGNRNNTVGLLSMILIDLNGHKVDKNIILNGLRYFNQFYCYPSLSTREVKNIFDSNFSRYRNGTLDTTKYLKKKRIFWSRKCQLTGTQKRYISNQINGQISKEKSLDVINQAIEVLQDGKNKITQKRIANNYPIGIATVKRHWEHFKELVAEYNQSIKSRSRDK